MSANREEDIQISEAYLNQSAISHMQQRRSDTGKYRPGSDLNNSNLQQFAGLTGNGNMNPGQLPSGADLSSDQEHEKLDGHILYDDDQTKEYPENPMVQISTGETLTLDELQKEVDLKIRALNQIYDQINDIAND